MKVSMLVPAFNEESRIGETLVAARRGLAQAEEEASVRIEPDVWVIDDGSRDATADVAAGLGARVVRLPRNRGKGAALTAGLRASAGEVIALLDADLRAHAAEVSRLLTPVLSGACDMAVAQFPAAGPASGFGLAKGLAGWGIRTVAGLDMRSPLSGQRALTRAVMERIGDRFARGWGVEVALTIDVACSGFRVMEIPVQMAQRVPGGRLSGVRHRASQLRDVGWALAPRLLRARGGPRARG